MADRNYLDLLDKEHQKMIALVGDEARNHHYKAYLVGGIVRDLILQRDNLDLDIVVEGDAIQLAQAVGKLLKMDLTVHEAFQTCTLYSQNCRRIDFATARREMYPKPGALPVVETAYLDADIFRRDFTVNALAISLNPGSYGKLIDHYGGLQDLDRGIIRIFHEKSFVDDPTRILRAVRFEQRFHFEIEQETKELLLSAVRQRTYASVKEPRYFNEFKKILMEEDPLPALARLKELGALNFWKAPLAFNQKDFALLRRKIAEAERKKLLTDHSARWLYYLMALVEDLDKRKVADILNNIQIRKEWVQSILESKDRSPMEKKLQRKNLRDSEIYEHLKTYLPETLLFVQFSSSVALVRQRIGHYLRNTRNTQLRVNGEDIKRLGVREGKKVGLILSKILHAKIDRGLTTKEQELIVAKQFLGLT